MAQVVGNVLNVRLLLEHPENPGGLLIHRPPASPAFYTHHELGKWAYTAGISVFIPHPVFKSLRIHQCCKVDLAFYYLPLWLQFTRCKFKCRHFTVSRPRVSVLPGFLPGSLVSFHLSETWQYSVGWLVVLNWTLSWMSKLFSTT